jgi:chloride channel 7
VTKHQQEKQLRAELDAMLQGPGYESSHGRDQDLTDSLLPSSCRTRSHIKGIVGTVEPESKPEHGEEKHSVKGHAVDYQDWESLDYTSIVNEYSVREDDERYQIKRTITGYTGRTLLRWLLTWAVGIIIALVAYCIGTASEHLVKRRMEIVTSRVAEEQGIWAAFPIFLGFAGWNMALACGASLLVLFVSPHAASSGIPEVKAVLNGLHVPKFLSLMTFVAKFIGIIMSVSSGLVLGPEGPLVHLGAIVGSAMTRGQKKIKLALCGKKKRHIYTCRLPAFMMQFRNDMDRRDFISIGASCGFAAAFGAPIGGVLFGMEEAASFWSDKLMWRCLTATTLATLVLRFFVEVSEMDSTQHFADLELGSYGLISLATSIADGVKMSLLLPVTVIGVYGGVVGAAFNMIMLQLNKVKVLRPKPIRKNWCHRLFIVALLSFFTSFLMFYGPHHAGRMNSWGGGWGCRTHAQVALSVNKTKSKAVEKSDLQFEDFWVQFNCPDGHYNDLASLLIGSKELAIKFILIDDNPHAFTWQSLLFAHAFFFSFLALTFGTAVPMGIFVPSILIGCTGGRLLGMIMSEANWTGVDEKQQGVFALMGAVAMLGGVQRSAVSLCIIILEGTGQIQFLLPIIWTTVFSRYVGNSFNEGLYELAIHVKRAPFIEHEPIPRMACHPVEEIMAGEVLTLPVEGCTVHDVYALLRSCWHNGFPVVDVEGRLCGLVLRSQLQVMISNIAFHTRGASDAQDLVDGQRDVLKMMSAEEQARSRSRGSFSRSVDELPPSPGRRAFKEEQAGGSREGSAGGAPSVEGQQMEQGEGQQMEQGVYSDESGQMKTATRSSVGKGAAAGRSTRSAQQDKDGLKGKCGSKPRTDNRRTMSRLMPGHPSQEEEQQPTQQYRYRNYVENMQVPVRKWKSKLVEDSTLDSFNLSGKDMKGILIDIKFAMNTALHTVQRTCPVSHAYSLFYTMGMRHLVVTDRGGIVVGMVTRKDICGLFHHAKEMKESAKHDKSRGSNIALKESFFSVTWNNFFSNRGSHSDDPRDDDSLQVLERFSASARLEGRRRSGSMTDVDALRSVSMHGTSDSDSRISAPDSGFLSWLPAPMLSPPPSAEPSSQLRVSGSGMKESLLTAPLDEPLPDHLTEI